MQSKNNREIPADLKQRFEEILEKHPRWTNLTKDHALELLQSAYELDRVQADSKAREVVRSMHGKTALERTKLIEQYATQRVSEATAGLMERVKELEENMPTEDWIKYAKSCIRDVKNERDRRDAEYRADKDHWG